MSAVAELVCRAWHETLDAAPGDTPWEEAGGDSLATLHLVYRLEQLLGRNLAFDLIHPDMTAAAMAAAIDDDAVTADAGLPRVFLLPGILGDGPSLAAFRRYLAPRIHLELIAPPGAGDPAALLGDVRACARRAAEAIMLRQPDGPLRVAGYSFGGCIALEAVADLVAAGRDVALAGVFDSAFGDAVLGLPRRPWRQRARRLAGQAASRAMAWDAGRRAGLRLADRLAPARSLALRRFVLRRFGTDARLRWQPRPLTVPLFLALSDEFAPVMGPVWQRLYPQVAVTRVPATHFGLFRGDALPVVAEAFAAAVAAG